MNETEESIINRHKRLHIKHMMDLRCCGFCVYYDKILSPRGINEECGKCSKRSDLGDLTIDGERINWVLRSHMTQDCDCIYYTTKELFNGLK